MKGLILVATAICLLAACKGGKHELSEGQMKQIMWDLSRGEAFHTYFLVRDSARNADSAAMAVYAKILAFHKVSADDFFYTLDIYRNDPKRYRILMDSVNAYGSKQREILFAPEETAADTSAPKVRKQIRSANELSVY